jgi:hypothetical protein
VRSQTIFIQFLLRFVLKIEINTHKRA